MTLPIPAVAADSLFESLSRPRLHDQRAIPSYKLMTNDCQPFLPLRDVVLPHPIPGGNFVA